METLKTIRDQVKKCMTSNNKPWKDGKCLNLIRSLESIIIIHRNKEQYKHSYYVSNLLYNIVHCGGIYTEEKYPYVIRSTGYGDYHGKIILKRLEDMAESCIYNQSPRDIDTLTSLRLISRYHNMDLTKRYHYHQYIADGLDYIIENVDLETGKVCKKKIIWKVPL